MTSKFSPKKERWVIYCFFLGVLALGLFLYRDFGVSTDEWMQRNIGQISLRYISNLFGWYSLFPGETPLANPTDAFQAFLHDRDRTYGVAFELPTELLTRLFSITNEAEIIFFRHGLNFLCFFIALIFFYRLLVARFQSCWQSLLGCLLLFLTPRIFGDAFYNSKDLVFMSFILICTYTMMCFLLRPRYSSALWHSLACAIAVDTRFLGLIIPALTFASLGALVWKKYISLGQAVRWGSIFGIACISLVILFWPWLWSDPVGNSQRLVEIFTSLRLDSTAKVDFPIIFMGDTISTARTPWYYLPIWIGITTPIPFLTLFLGGTCLTIWRSLKASHQNDSSSLLFEDQLILLLFWLPVLAIMIMRPTFYNGWRHLYFIYPFLIYLAIVAAQWLWQRCKERKSYQVIYFSICSALLIWSFATLMHWHPYSYLYFNQLAGHWSEKFDTDYWGVSYRTPIEKIVRQSKDKKYVLYDFHEDLYVVNLVFLDPSERERLIVNRSEACSDYILIGSRGPYKQYTERKEFQLFNELKINGELVHAIFKRIHPLQDRSKPDLNEFIEWSNPDQRCFIPLGWSENTENWGVWSQGKTATINLPLPILPAKELVLDLRAFVNPVHPLQKIRIAVDGGQLHAYDLHSFDKNIIVLPLKKSQKENSIQLTFELPDAVSPKSLGLGEDIRELSIGLKRTFFR